MSTKSNAYNIFLSKIKTGIPSLPKFSPEITQVGVLLSSLATRICTNPAH